MHLAQPLLLEEEAGVSGASEHPLPDRRRHPASVPSIQPTTARQGARDAAAERSLPESSCHSPRWTEDAHVGGRVASLEPGGCQRPGTWRCYTQML